MFYNTVFMYGPKIISCMLSTNVQSASEWPPLPGHIQSAVHSPQQVRSQAACDGAREVETVFSGDFRSGITSGQVQLTLRQQQSLRRLLYHCATDLQLLDQQLTMKSDNSSQLYSLDVASGHTGKQQLQRQILQMKHNTRN